MIIPSCQGQWNFLNRPSSSIPILCAWLPTWSPSTPQSMPPTIGRCGFFEMGTSQPQEKEEKSSTDGFLEMDFPCASWFTEGWGFVSFFFQKIHIFPFVILPWTSKDTQGAPVMGRAWLLDADPLADGRILKISTIKSAERRQDLTLKWTDLWDMDLSSFFRQKKQLRNGLWQRKFVSK